MCHVKLNTAFLHVVHTRSKNTKEQDRYQAGCPGIITQPPPRFTTMISCGTTVVIHFNVNKPQLK